VRLVHVSDCYPPRTGGIESHVSDLAARQAVTGDEVHVLTATPSADGARHGVVEEVSGVQVHRMGTRLPFELPVNPVEGPRLLRAALRTIRPDVVHVHAGMVSPFAFDGARLAVAAGLPTVITWHCMLDRVLPALRLGVRTTRWRTVPAALTAVSDSAARRVEAVFGAPVEVLPNGLDMATWAPAGPDPGRSSGPLHLVATMRLVPRKRTLPLVRMVARAAERLPPDRVRLTVIGSGPSEGRVRAAVTRLGMERQVTLAGRLDRPAVRERYRDADVFVAPAASEAFGIAALEARASGLIVLGRRGTGMAEFVTDGVDGWLVDDDAQMVDTIVRLARDPALTGRMLAHNRQVRPAFDWSDVLEAARAQYARAARLVG